MSGHANPTGSLVPAADAKMPGALLLHVFCQEADGDQLVALWSDPRLASQN
jgi:hypothetical protein